MRFVARLLCVMTFPVLWVGGLVTSTKAGMAVPDWPNTYGYNMFLYPLTWWLWGPWDLFVEHGHRLLASALGLCAIVLAILLWRDATRPLWLRRMGVVTLLAVIGQGVLGGARVVLDARLAAMIHGVTGPLFFALAVAMVAWTSHWWQRHEPARSQSVPDLRPLAILLLAVVCTQLVLGAIVRHLPPQFSPGTFLAIVRLHLTFAVIVALTWTLVLWVARRREAPVATRRMVSLAGVLLALQLLLGVVAWCYKYAVPQWLEELTGWSLGTIVADGWGQSTLVTAHQANGSLLLAASAGLLLVTWRLAPTCLTESTSTPTGAPARSVSA